jgi:hypothetical protein
MYYTIAQALSSQYFKLCLGLVPETFHEVVKTINSSGGRLPNLGKNPKLEVRRAIHGAHGSFAYPLQ